MTTTHPSANDSGLNLDHLEALARAATPGPWAYQEDSDAYTHIVRPVASPGWIAAANPAAVLELIALARRAALANQPAPTADYDRGYADGLKWCDENWDKPAPTVPAGDVREAFEAWHRSKFATKHSTGQPTRDMHNGIYAEKYGPESQQQMWEVWQAALAHQPAQEQAEPLKVIEAALLQARNPMGDRLTHINAALNATQALLAAQQEPVAAPQQAAAPKRPFPISDDEIAALSRFWECATDGEGYDVEKAMMQRLAEMGLVQRKSGAYYMATEFGLYVLGEYTVERAAQLDGGQEGSAT